MIGYADSLQALAGYACGLGLDEKSTALTDEYLDQMRNEGRLFTRSYTSGMANRGFHAADFLENDPTGALILGKHEGYDIEGGLHHLYVSFARKDAASAFGRDFDRVWPLYLADNFFCLQLTSACLARTRTLCNEDIEEAVEKLADKLVDYIDIWDEDGETWRAVFAMLRERRDEALEAMK